MAQITAIQQMMQDLIIEGYDITKLSIMEKYLELERKQRIECYNAGYDDAKCNHINDAENYVTESIY